MLRRVPKASYKWTNLNVQIPSLNGRPSGGFGQKRSHEEVNYPEAADYWRIPDTLWQRIELPQAQGRKASCGLPAMYGPRAVCQCYALPQCIGPASMVHSRFQGWRLVGVFRKLWRDCLVELDNR